MQGWGVRVSRSQVLRTAGTMVRRLTGGRGGAVLVVGEAGIGKTWLLAEASRSAARHGIPVVRSAALPVAEPLPYDLVGEMMRGLRRAGRLGQTRIPHGPAAFRVLTRYLSQATTDGPVLLVVDDLHWSDAATVDLLRYAVARMADLPLGWLLASRPGEVATRLGHDLVRDGLCRWVTLGPFSTSELKALVRAQLPELADPAAAGELLHQRTGGNPFLATEVIRSVRVVGRSGEGARELRMRTPDSVGEWVVGRMASLSQTARDLLAWAALLPEPVRDDQLGAVCQASPDDVSAALDRLGAERLLDAGESGWTFRHALIRDAVRDRIPPGERQRRCAAAADALDSVPATARAPLLAAAGRSGDAASAYLSLADEALRRSGGRDADQFYQQAQELAERAGAAGLRDDAAAGRVLALLLTGQTEPARQLADALLRRLRMRSSDDLRRLVFLSRYALALEDDVSDLDAAVEATAEAWPLVAAASGRPLAEALLARAFVLTMAGQAEEVVADAEHAAALARQLGDAELEVRALNRLGLAVGEARSAAEGMVLLESARDLAEAEGLAGEIALACLNLSHLAGASADAAAMRDWAVRGLQVPSSATIEAMLRSNAGDALKDLGDLDAALAYHVAARSVAASAGGLAEARIVVGQCYVLALRGDRAEARRLLEQVSFRTGSFDHQRLLEARAVIDEEDGRLAEALTGYSAGAEWSGYPHTAWCLAGLARTAIPLGQLDAARSALARLDTLAASWPAAGWLAEASRGWVALGNGDANDAAAAFRQAATDCSEAFERTRLRLAAGLAVCDRDEVARACDAFTRMGAIAAAQRAQAAARGAGMRLGGPRPRRTHGVLTGREEQIALAVASGKTNAEIATDLYLSIRTVEHHVTNICTKLDYRSRVQIAAEVAAGKLPGSRPEAILATAR